MPTTLPVCHVLVNGVKISAGIQFRDVGSILDSISCQKRKKMGEKKKDYRNFVRDCVESVDQFVEYCHLNNIKSSDPCPCDVIPFN